MSVGLGTKRRSGNVGYFAACGGRADLRQTAEIDAVDPKLPSKHVRSTAAIGGQRGQREHSLTVIWGGGTGRKAP
jgi:hypothetical protein